MFICEKGLNCRDCHNFDVMKLCEHWIEVKPVVRGHWDHSRFHPVYQERCSVCEEWSSDYANFCPYCGAKMKACKEE